MADGENTVGIGSVLTGSDCKDTIELLGARCVDALDARVRMRRMQDLADQHAGKGEVVGVLAGARGLFRRINHGDRLADDGEVGHGGNGDVGTAALGYPVERSSTALFYAVPPHSVINLSLTRVNALG